MATGKRNPIIFSTVDTDHATWEDSIGDAVLMTVWTAPKFNSNAKAFYYLRVIEIPTPRWTTYDARQFGLTLPEEIPLVHTERAYTSSIWYRP